MRRTALVFEPHSPQYTTVDLETMSDINCLMGYHPVELLRHPMDEWSAYVIKDAMMLGLAPNRMAWNVLAELGFCPPLNSLVSVYFGPVLLLGPRKGGLRRHQFPRVQTAHDEHMAKDHLMLESLTILRAHRVQEKALLSHV